MKSNFDIALSFVFQWEGYKSNDPQDSGGKTIFGISSKAHPKDVTKMWDLPKEEAKQIASEIYKNDYWNAMELDDMESKKDIFLFDTAVNMGTGYARKIEDLELNDMILARIKRYNEISARDNLKFLRGWLSRVLVLVELLKTI